MTTDNQSDIDISQELVKLAGNTINLAFEYHRCKATLDALIAKYPPARGISFYHLQMVPQFMCLEDKPFRDAILKIEKSNLSMEKKYMAHFSELGRLLTRAGIMPRPDTIVKMYSADAPHDISEIHPLNTENADTTGDWVEVEQ